MILRPALGGGYFAILCIGSLALLRGQAFFDLDLHAHLAHEWGHRQAGKRVADQAL